MSKSRLASIAAAVGLVVALASCGGDEVESIKFGTITSFNANGVLAIAEDQGLWEEEGIEVEVLEFTNGPIQIQALGAGDLDFGYIGAGAMWLPATGESKIVAINTLGKGDRVFAQAGDITSLEGLAGRTVAVTEGTTGEMILKLALESVGMTPDDIETVAMDPGTIVSAFTSGQVEAAALWYPLVGLIEQDVPDVQMLAESNDFIDQVAFPSAYVASNEIVAENPELVTKVLRVLRKAMEWRSDNVEETIDLVADMTELERDAVAIEAGTTEVLSGHDVEGLWDDGTISTWMNTLNGFFIEFGTISEADDPSSYYTHQLFADAGE